MSTFIGLGVFVDAVDMFPFAWGHGDSGLPCGGVCGGWELPGAPSEGEEAGA